ncbi:murein biosynthesis integral membrane protein MurJ [Streptomyces cinereoruber]|uniref:Murein biosynthesis integral membrane protein MurJ n=1 Tax=Streptomyces cinereoruber TaxID=67260 RepID=A0ABX6BSB6_9ACTN|nr:murein biosynthesis integral membrane protein MurJ [Streptomyces cinereoruber]MBY8814924.1 murein biosynthesis integral membrane protein MurJ [Streptomyces cinereoruber]QEV36961.1 murein biosynthesis integral membrane protein MurJ [Streptomyces cinereoruber]
MAVRHRSEGTVAATTTKPTATPPAPPRPGRRAHARARGARADRPQGRGFLAKAAAVTAGLTAVGSVLGLVRDQILAGYFGAGAATDAFLVAWTVPEFASTLLIEDAMALILVPAFSRALARRGDGALGDPVRALVRGTLPRLTLTVGLAAAVLVVAAPLLVAALAPGLPDPALAIDCTRLTATCVLSFALVGYCSAALRAHGRFLPPALIYTAYNVGIIGTILVLREPWGVRSAAAGVAVGGVLMVLVQAPFLVRELRSGSVPPPPRPPRASRASRGGQDGRILVIGLIAPVVAFSLCRQSQTLIERFLASPLPAGAISHLNYAQKVAQLPMILSLMLCTVSFPVVARALAAGDEETARHRVERDLLLAAVVVLVGASTVIAAAPRIVELLFERGEFGGADTTATAAVMRVYALGLLGQTMVGALVRCYFSAARPLWYPAAAMGAGLVATGAAGVPGAQYWGAVGIAGANALGITLTAVLLLRGAHRQSVPVRSGRLGTQLLRLAAAGACATGAGWICSVAIGPAVPAVAVAALAATGVLVLFLACAPEASGLPSLPRSAYRRTPHARRHRAEPSAAEAFPAAETAPVGGDVPLDRGHRR